MWQPMGRPEAMILETIRVSMSLWTWVAGWIIAAAGGAIIATLAAKRRR